MLFKKLSYQTLLAYILFIILFLVGLYTYKDYGIGIDDKFHRLNGFYWLDYLLSFTNFEQLKINVNHKLASINDLSLPSIKLYNSYGIVFDVPAALLEVLFKKDTPKEFYEFKHFLNFLYFFIGCIVFYKILKLRFNDTISLIGSLLYILSPRIYGESFYNMKDIIYLTFLCTAYYYCLKNFMSLSYKNLFFLALSSAICIQLRIFGLMIPIFFCLFYFLSLMAKNKHIHEIYKIIFFLFSTVLLTYILWPHLWTNTLDNFFKLFDNTMPNAYVLFNGNYYDNNFLPYVYVPLWILITTPVLHILLFFIGFFILFKRIFYRLINIKDKSISYDLWRSKNEKFDIFLFLNFLILLIFIILTNTKLLNAWKHLYFLNFYFIYIATFFIDILLKKKVIYKYLRVLLIIFIFFNVITFLRMYIYHPYQGLYFNILITDKYKNMFDVDFTSLSARHFFDKIFQIHKDDESEIYIAAASWTPLNRTLEIYTDKKIEKIKLTDLKFDEVKYIYTNNISEVDKNVVDKYNISDNFEKFYDLIVDGIIIYSIYIKR